MLRHCLLALSVVVVSCNDPVSDLGADLVGGGLEPEIAYLAPTEFAASPIADITGQAQRVMTGRVDDPLLGSVDVTGYIDFTTGFVGTGPQVTGAELHLAANYVYGDTMGSITVAVHSILEDWMAAGTKADTTLPVGPEILTHTFLSSDTLVVIPMPEAWINTYGDTLQSADAGTLFHGLAIAPVDGQAVVGFGNVGTALMVHTDDDTTAFDYQRSVTATSRLSDPVVAADRLVVMDGSGPTVRVNFDLEALASQPINGAVFLLFADTVAHAEAPPDFVRPAIESLQLVAVRSVDEPALLVGEASPTDEGIVSFSGAEMATFFYRVLFDFETYEYLELRVPVLDNTLSSLVIYGDSTGDHAPELRLILGS